jgi:hypothetical protein
LRNAIARKLPTVEHLRHGIVLYDDGSADASELRRALGL